MKSLINWIKESWARSTTNKGQRGSVDITSIIMMGIGMVFLAIGFIIYPLVTTATDSILAYSYTSNTSITDSTYTGLTSVTGIVPLLVLLGFVVAAVVEMWLGVQVARGTRAQAKVDLGATMLLGISMVFIAVGLIMFPIVLDGISSVLHGSGAGISSSYTGLSSIIKIVPLIVLVAFVTASAVFGYFGVKTMNKA